MASPPADPEDPGVPFPGAVQLPPLPPLPLGADIVPELTTLITLPETQPLPVDISVWMTPGLTTTVTETRSVGLPAAAKMLYGTLLETAMTSVMNRGAAPLKAILIAMVSASLADMLDLVARAAVARLQHEEVASAELERRVDRASRAATDPLE